MDQIRRDSDSESTASGFTMLDVSEVIDERRPSRRWSQDARDQDSTIQDSSRDQDSGRRLSYVGRSQDRQQPPPLSPNLSFAPGVGTWDATRDATRPDTTRRGATKEAPPSYNMDNMGEPHRASQDYGQGIVPVRVPIRDRNCNPNSNPNPNLQGIVPDRVRRAVSQRLALDVHKPGSGLNEPDKESGTGGKEVKEDNPNWCNYQWGARRVSLRPRTSGRARLKSAKERQSPNRNPNPNPNPNPKNCQGTSR